tara:strand:- start:1681 stop:1944 length:264 start_codon:yes stop_codon:yes gene_type:complete
MTNKIVLETTLPKGVDEELEGIQKELETMQEKSRKLSEQLQEIGWDLRDYYKDLYEDTNTQIQVIAYELDRFNIDKKLLKIRIEHAK